MNRKQQHINYALNIIIHICCPKGLLLTILLTRKHPLHNKITIYVSQVINKKMRQDDWFKKGHEEPIKMYMKGVTAR